MKILTYKTEVYVDDYNPETNEVEKQPYLAKVIIEKPSEKDVENAKELAYNGECTIEDDGQPEKVSDGQRITQLEEALELLLSGVTE